MHNKNNKMYKKCSQIFQIENLSHSSVLDKIYDNIKFVSEWSSILSPFLIFYRKLIAKLGFRFQLQLSQKSSQNFILRMVLSFVKIHINYDGTHKNRNKNYKSFFFNHSTVVSALLSPKLSRAVCRIQTLRTSQWLPVLLQLFQVDMICNGDMIGWSPEQLVVLVSILCLGFCGFLALVKLILVQKNFSLR